MNISKTKQAEFERMVQAINGDRNNEKGDGPIIDPKPDLIPAIVEVETEPETNLGNLSKSEFLKEAKEYAEMIITEYNMPISMRDFAIKISEQMTRARGKCRRKNGNIQIRLSWPGYENHGWEETRHTIRHELIHVHQFVNHGEVSHGSTFKEWSGSDKLDVTVYADSASSEGKYTIECPECGEQWNRQRDCKLVRQAGDRTCPKCQTTTGLEVTVNE